MAILSSHVLDSVIGDHARGIRIELYALNESGPELLFDLTANDEGRIVETVELTADGEYQLVFHSAAYFAGRADYSNPLPRDGMQIMPTVVINLTLPDPEARYHVPLVLSPHAYSVWWSG